MQLASDAVWILAATLIVSLGVRPAPAAGPATPGEGRIINCDRAGNFPRRRGTTAACGFAIRCASDSDCETASDCDSYRCADAEPPANVSTARPDGDGILVHEVKSAFQAGATQIRVLLPSPLDKARRYPVIYVLPVEAGNEAHYGNGLLEVKKNDLANRYQAVFVAPTLSQLPWYADHPSDPNIRQETYLLSVVLPFVEKNYPVRSDPGGRLLMGFSKSGWGAFCLLLRHPDLFGKAAAWDAPLMMGWPSQYGSTPIFGTRENFAKYQISTLLQKRAANPGTDKRLILMGYGNFRAETDRAHALMDRLKIPHEFAPGPRRKHEWASGWVPEAVKLLLGAETKAGP